MQQALSATMVHVNTEKSVVPPPPAADPRLDKQERKPRKRHQRRVSRIEAGLASILPDFARTDVLPDFAKKGIKEGLKITRLDRLFKVLLQFEARHHNTLQGIPHTVPMVTACFCLFLLVLPIHDAIKEPVLLQTALVLIFIAALGWILIQVGNDYAHFRHGLLKPQRPRLVLWMAAGGITVLTLRIVNLTSAPTLGSGTSVEYIQRYLVGIPYFVLRFFGLDMWGTVIGVLLFAGFISFGFLACCLFNCCGRVRLAQSLLRRVRQRPERRECRERRGGHHRRDGHPPALSPPCARAASARADPRSRVSTHPSPSMCVPSTSTPRSGATRCPLWTWSPTASPSSRTTPSSLSTPSPSSPPLSSAARCLLSRRARSRPRGRS